MFVSGGPTRPRAPGTPEISWQALQPYLRISTLPTRALPPLVNTAASFTRLSLRLSQPADSRAAIAAVMRSADLISDFQPVNRKVAPCACIASALATAPSISREE